MRHKSLGRKRVPTAADYMRALQALAPLPPSYVRMLRFHYREPARTATAAAVARAAEFKHFRATSLHCGRLAGLVGEHLGWRPQEGGKVKLNVLVKFHRRGGHWRWIMRRELAEAPERLGWAGPTLELMPGEVPEGAQLQEGAAYRVVVTAYERNPEARRMCLAHYGTSCVVCGFDFQAAYGAVAAGFIHVHHIRLLSDIGKEYGVDPIKDLRPVCPDCHSVIHLKAPSFSIGELKRVVAACRGSK